MEPAERDRVLERARDIVRQEADALADLADELSASFLDAAAVLHRAIAEPGEGRPGKIVVTGVGKSGLIGRSLAATFNATGATAFFLHPVEAVHGDLGIIDPGDAVILLSRSGASDELRQLIPSLRAAGVPLIAITARDDSELARFADVSIAIGDRPEACSLNLTPTTSATATLAIGHALALTLFEWRGLKEEDFARFHPGGLLGKRLLLRVKDVMHTGDGIPRVTLETDMRTVLIEIMGKRLGAAAVVEGERLAGIITDGDLKRIVLSHDDLFEVPVSEVMTARPQTIGPDDLVADAYRKMHANPDAVITCLPVVTGERLTGFLHMYDCLKSGAIG
ncbi:MAG: KpsF/GutQ family sugar-phosphate isomerase [Gemmatimonadetes bacterium]|nr:KpsF/GutQ family sugar-phosphate isomerase [Gemmatimonadota bacterium]